ncbi:MAG: hypothetical protein JXN61_01580 [Sedimentisphaerales bacterium]|nr:hypothetical protein [Sedimentisphaerales bacterium]
MSDMTGCCGAVCSECGAFIATMTDDGKRDEVALLWRRLRNIASEREVLQTGLFVSLYGCLPTCSFAAILVGIWVIGGKSLLNVEQANKFGIPRFVPWPFNTMLGFCLALAAGTILLKTGATMGMAHMLIRCGQEPKSGNHLETRA